MALANGNTDAKAVAAAKARVLPSKESALFKTLLVGSRTRESVLGCRTDVARSLDSQQAYETKQHKQAIKAADQILKKCPGHGGGLVMSSPTTRVPN